MRRAVRTEGGLDVVEAEPAPLAPGRVRLQVEACGICGSDLHVWTGHAPRAIGSAPEVTVVA